MESLSGEGVKIPLNMETFRTELETAIRDLEHDKNINLSLVTRKSGETDLAHGNRLLDLANRSHSTDGT